MIDPSLASFARDSRIFIAPLLASGVSASDLKTNLNTPMTITSLIVFSSRSKNLMACVGIVPVSTLGMLSSAKIPGPGFRVGCSDNTGRVRLIDVLVLRSVL
jgi:hypothetical protein